MGMGRYPRPGGVIVSGRSRAAPRRSAASADVGVVYGAVWIFGVGAGAAGAAGSGALSEPVSEPHAAAPKITAAVVATAAVRTEYRRRRVVVVVFMVVPLVDLVI
jgi:hypothetical protein